MSFFSLHTGQGRTHCAQAAVALVVAALIAGCGDNYRPVVTPVVSSGPPAQISAYAVVISAPSPTTNGIFTMIDYSGDTIMNETPIGPGPRIFTIDETGSTGYTLNSDGTLSNFSLSTSLQQKDIAFSTLPQNSRPVNLMPPAAGLWITDLNGDLVDIFSGSPQAFRSSVPLGSTASPATMPVYIGGAALLTGEREYVLSQNLPDATGQMTCNVSPQTAPRGVATPVEISTTTADPGIPVGRCPVFGITSADQQRFFVLNRGDDTITVINSKNNTLDTCTPFQNQNGQTVRCHPTLPLSTTAVTNTGITPPNGTAGMTAVAGPVYGEYNAATQQIVVANYDGGSVSVIDVSLDQYGNDSPTFGTTYTIPVGNTATPNPAAVTVLYDGSKAYTANQNDGTQNGTVSVVNLATHTLEKTLTVVGHPRMVASIQNSEYSKIYVASPDSPYVTIVQSTPSVNDLIDTTVLVQGHVVDLRATTPNGGNNTVLYSSRVPGYGQPCNLPGTASLASLTACQAQP